MRVSFYCFLLTFLFFLVSISAQATEYREVDKEVNASDILKHTEMGEDINLDNCNVVGELNASKIKTVPNPLYYRLLQAGVSNDSITNWGCNENLHIIESNLTIINTTFQNKVDLSNTLFQNSVDFERAAFNGSVDFSWTTFNGSANFKGSTLNNSADFKYVRFKNSSNFKGSTFNSDADFQSAVFYDFADFTSATFNNSADFFWANFYGLAEFAFVYINNNSNFNDATFNNDADFQSATFNNDADFMGSNFNNGADFQSATFNNSARFVGAAFKKDSGFMGSYFNNGADFSMAIFYYPIYFMGSNFNNDANFYLTNFSNTSNFKLATFDNLADFSSAMFYNSTDFSSLTLSSSADFKLPSTYENIVITDGKTCEIFRKLFNEKSLYEDADRIYYNFRKITMDEEDISLSKLIDFISWVTCGFGTKLEYTFGCIIAIIIFFAFLYKNPGLSLLYWIIALQFVDAKIKILKPDEYKSRYKESGTTELSLKLYWGSPGIYKLAEKVENEKLPSDWDLLYYSINTFTRLGSSNWYSKDSFRKIETLESVLGWVMLAIFLATLMHLLIRP